MIAQTALAGQAESVHSISCPSREVFVLGAQKLPYLTPVAVIPLHRSKFRVGCFCGSKTPSIQSSANLHCPQKAIHAMARTAASKVLELDRFDLSTRRCAMVTASLFGLLEVEGAAADAPWRTCLRWEHPYQGA